MRKLFEEFLPTSLETWTDQIVKDLKGKELSILDFHDTIEELDYRAFYHADNTPIASLQPGDFPATRGSKTTTNDWANGAWIRVENAVEANKQALHFLMTGADLLCFEAASDAIDWSKVLEGIELPYIKAQFHVTSTDTAAEILAIAGEAKNQISFCFDALDTTQYPSIAHLMVAHQTPSVAVNGFKVQQCGATTWQEIAFCLSAGHEALVQFMQNGMDIDQAAAMIHFHVGVGANYFNEIAKFRALRMLWSKVIAAYHPNHACSHNCQITAIVGHTNKSLKDPYTNLLRQTTEAMSAANGADAIVVLPYDFHSKEGSSDLAQRMALNISLILKEESYLGHVIDPTGGSYSVEQLTRKIAEKSWAYFQKIEGNGGISQPAASKLFTGDVNEKRHLRELAVSEGKQTFIGINKFLDPNPKDLAWIQPEGYLGMDVFLADLIVKTDLV